MVKKLDAFVNWMNCRNKERAELPKNPQKHYYTKKQGRLKILNGKKPTKRQFDYQLVTMYNGQ